MLRVSTANFYRSGESNIVERQAELLKVQAQLASGKRINSPGDDPLGAADVNSIRSGLSQFAQFKDNQGHARYLLNLADSAIAGVVQTVQDVQTRLVEAGSGVLSDADRRTLATDLEGQLARLVGLANSPDGAGGYLFAGARENTVPFAQSGTTVTFAGDDILQKLEISKDRFQQVKFSGDGLFLKARAGNGSFTTDAAAANTGSGWIDSGTVTSPAALTGRPYRIEFAVTGGVTSFSVQRDDGGGAFTTVVPATPYTAPQSIGFDGIQVGIAGTPANNDRFDIAPAPYQSLFDTVARAIATLRAPVQGNAAAQAQFRTDLSQARASMQQALDQVLLKRSAIGTSLAELDNYETLADDRQLQYQSRLSAVEDLDYAQGVSELARRQSAFEAALASYSKVSKLTLFDYL